MYSENDIIRWNDMRVKGLYFHHYNVETIQEGFTRTRKNTSVKQEFVKVVSFKNLKIYVSERQTDGVCVFINLRNKYKVNQWEYYEDATRSLGSVVELNENPSQVEVRPVQRLSV